MVKYILGLYWCMMGPGCLWLSNLTPLSIEESICRMCTCALCCINNTTLYDPVTSEGVQLSIPRGVLS